MLNPRLDLLTDYPFDRLRALLDGIDPPEDLEPLFLSIGEPQHPPPPVISETLEATAGLWGKYPPIDGTPEWREAVAGWLERRYGAGDAAVLPVAGTREALFMSGMLAVSEGGPDQPIVLIPNPFYQVYSGTAVMAGAEAVFLSATRETGFLPDLEAVAEETLARTALMFLCSPSNPQGTVADLAYLKRAIGLARQYGFVLVLDECYGEIWDRTPPPGGLEACRALGDGYGNVLVFHSLSKRSSAAGLRSGFVAGDSGILARFRRLRSYGGATLGLPIQAASAKLWADNGHVEANRALYREKFDIAEAVLRGRFGFFRPAGGFFLWLAVDDGERAARELWARGGLRVLPGAYLAREDAGGGNPGAPYIRVALVHDPDTTRDALNRLVNIL